MSQESNGGDPTTKALNSASMAVTIIGSLFAVWQSTVNDGVSALGLWVGIPLVVCGVVLLTKGTSKATKKISELQGDLVVKDGKITELTNFILEDKKALIEINKKEGQKISADHASASKRFEELRKGESRYTADYKKAEQDLAHENSRVVTIRERIEWLDKLS